MPRITVLAEKEIVDPKMNEVEREFSPKKFQWIKRSIHSEEISEFEFDTKKTTLLTLLDGNNVVIQESFDEFETRINTIEEWIDPIPLAEEIAKHLAVIFSPETPEETEENI